MLEISYINLFPEDDKKYSNLYYERYFLRYIIRLSRLSKKSDKLVNK